MQPANDPAPRADDPVTRAGGPGADDPRPPAPAPAAGVPPGAGAGAAAGRIRSGSDASVIDLSDASKDYGEGVGVRNMTFQVPAGAILGVVGPSGAGKTTVIRLITGALDPTSGSVRVLGEDPRRFRRRTRERIGYMPQLFTLYPDLTADENIDFVASMFGLLWYKRRRRVREVLRLVELWEARNRRAGRLSGGMQRRLELACALVHEPDLLLLDEPTAGIDPILRQTIWAELGRLKDAGRTLLVTTQYVTEAESCDAVALVTGGRLVALDEPEALRRRAAGGDLVEVETEAPFDPAVLSGVEGIRSGESRGLRTFRLAVDDVGTFLPAVDDVIAAKGGTIVSAREVRLTFDEVFAVLVGEAEMDQEAVDNAAGASDHGAGSSAGRSAA